MTEVTATTEVAMLQCRSKPSAHRPVRRKICALGASAALILSAGLSMGGCNDDFDEFRAAASPRLEAGVNALLDGLVDGIFAVVEPNTQTATTTSTP